MSRVRPIDAQSAIFKSKKKVNEEPSPKTNKSGVTLYTLDALKDDEDNKGYPTVTAKPNPGREYDDRVCAKMVVSKRGIKYFARIDRHGYFYDEIAMDNLLSKRRRDEPQFVEVNEEAFSHYREYLKSNNQNNLKSAHRAIY